MTGAFALALAAILVLWFGVAPWKMAAIGVPTLLLALAWPGHPQLAFVVATLGLTVLLTTARNTDGELEEWFDTSWDFAKKILPLLLWGVLIAGALLGRPDHEGLIPSPWIAHLVGRNNFV